MRRFTSSPALYALHTSLARTLSSAPISTIIQRQRLSKLHWRMKHQQGKAGENTALHPPYDSSLRTTRCVSALASCNMSASSIIPARYDPVKGQFNHGSRVFMQVDHMEWPWEHDRVYTEVYAHMGGIDHRVRYLPVASSPYPLDCSACLTGQCCGFSTSRLKAWARRQPGSRRPL